MVVFKHTPDKVSCSDNSALNYKSYSKYFNLLALKGRSALYQIIKSFGIKNSNIAIPYYICPIVEKVIIDSKNKPFYIDIDPKDFNISIISLIKACNKNKIVAVIVPSVYGNPANLVEIEKFCQENDVIMIDDAAQSFGCTIDSRRVGTFGDAGLISFGPGKPLNSFSGSMYWSNNIHNDNVLSGNMLLTYILQNDYIENRINISSKNFFYSYFFSKSRRIIENYIGSGIYSLGVTDRHLQRMLCALNNYSLLLQYKKEFINLFSDGDFYKIIRPLRGRSNYYRFIILIEDIKIAEQFRYFLLDRGIYTMKPYNALSGNFDNYELIRGKLFDIPIDPIMEKRKYTELCLNEFGIV